MKLVLFTLLVTTILGFQKPIESTSSTNKNISGTWVITSHRIVKPANEYHISKFGAGSLISLFGTEDWSQSTGKTFNLLPDGHVNSNIDDSSLISQIDLKYEIVNDSTIEFNCITFSDSTRNVMPVKYELEHKSMTWLIDDILEVKLHKQ